MRKLLFVAIAIMASMFVFESCKSEKSKDADTMRVVRTELPTNLQDSTMFGICGEGTSMHNLQLILNNGDSIDIYIDDEFAPVPGIDIVQGGLLCGDKMAVIALIDEDHRYIAQKIINVSTLVAKWCNTDLMNSTLEFNEDGTMISRQESERGGYNSWRIVNGNLLLSTDTFSIINLTADSLMLENTKGISVYRRMK